MSQDPTNSFAGTVEEIAEIGRDWHREKILKNAERNKSLIDKSIKDLPKAEGEKAEAAIVINAGPSLGKNKILKRIKESNFKGSIVAIDGSYVACLREGIVPDYVVTLDPHPTRVVAWFGGWKPDEKDDYFKRQDLNTDFRKINPERDAENKRLVDEHGHKTKALVCVTAPENVARRMDEAGFDKYWWNPLVDDPTKPDSITRELYKINKLQCMNTGGNVGTASWVFASSVLKSPLIALTGMDLAYYPDLPLENTQLYYELLDRTKKTGESIDDFFVEFTFPLTGEKFYTDPTFYWYRKNFFELLKHSQGKTVNCSEGGCVFSEELDCIYLDQFLDPEWRKSNG